MKEDVIPMHECARDFREGPVCEERGEELTPLRQYQLVELKILKEFIRVCEENDLTWWIAWGSLLGAARHQGFIPWDDDIDVWMPADDYLKFRELCHAGALGEEFYFQAHADCVYDQIYWQRIGLKHTTSLPRDYRDVPGHWGVCIDIFPLSYAPAPDNAKESRRYRAREKRFDRLASRYYYKKEAQLHGGLRRLYCRFMSRGSDEKHLELWKRFEARYLAGWDYRDHSCFSASSGRVTAACFDETVELPFEDITVKAPAGYAQILTELYGSDWNELPPEEKRVWHSGGESGEVIVSLTEPWTTFME